VNATQPPKAMKKLTAAGMLVALLGAGAARGQTIVYSDDFSVSQGASYTTSGAIGTSPWSVARSGDDWGARIDGGVMTLNNDATAAAQANGWVYAHRQLSDSGPFNTIFSSSVGTMTWSFNMQQARTNPAGFSPGSYGVAYVIGTSSTLVATQGSGYAVVLGNTGTPDPVRFVSFTGGLSSLGAAATSLISAAGDLSNPTNSHMSIRLTYNPSDSRWELFGRNDGTSFSDPNTGTLSSFGSVVDSTHTGVALTSGGAYWQGATAGGQTALFDNVSLQVVPEPSTYALLLLGSALLGHSLFPKLRKARAG
jgi:hypothetical protein